MSKNTTRGCQKESDLSIVENWTVGVASLLNIINRIAALEQRINADPAFQPLQRSLEGLKASIEDIGFKYQIPVGQSYSSTRSDLEASFADSVQENLKVISMIRPIIHLKRKDVDAMLMLVQKGKVVVKGATNE